MLKSKAWPADGRAFPTVGTADARVFPTLVDPRAFPTLVDPRAFLTLVDPGEICLMVGLDDVPKIEALMGISLVQ